MEVDSPPKLVAKMATQYLEEYHAAMNAKSDVRPLSIQPVRWLPPQGQTYKANVNGVVFAKLKAVGIGVVIWNKEGKVKATLSKKIKLSQAPVEAEAKAFEVGLQFAKDVGIRDVMVEVDSFIKQRALNELVLPPPSVDAVIMGTSF